MQASERKLEGAIEAWLLEHGGYLKGDPGTFDRALGLDSGEVLAFVRTTQRQAWAALAARHGREAAAAASLLRRLAKELDERGTGARRGRHAVPAVQQRVGGGRAGNPLNPRGHKTAYLWEEVWQRDGWLDRPLRPG